MSTTTTHMLKLIPGTLTVAITESTDAIYFGISGAKPFGCELPKLERFLWPLFDQYRDDARRVEVSGTRCAYIGHVDPLGGDAWVAYQTEPGASA